MNIICKLKGHAWGRWYRSFFTGEWTRYCLRTCGHNQLAGRGKRPNYKGLELLWPS